MQTGRKNTPKTNTTTTTTSTTYTPPEDLTRRPSPETAMLLLLLAAEGPLDYRELAEILGIDVKHVYDRVRYFARKGWVTRNPPYVKLTDVGLMYVLRYAGYLARVASTRYGDYAKSVSTRLIASKGTPNGRSNDLGRR